MPSQPLVHMNETGWSQGGKRRSSRAWFQEAMRPVQQRLEALLAQGSRCGHAKTESTCRCILKQAPAPPAVN